MINIARLEMRRAETLYRQALVKHAADKRNNARAELDWHNFNAWLEAKAKEEV